MTSRIPLRSLAALGLALAPAAGLAQSRQANTEQAAVVKALHRGPAAPGAEADPDPGEYLIGPADVLAIDVWREQEVSRVEPVRPDGRITLPLAGEIQASGETPKSLEAEIARRLGHYIHQPAVTVIVQQANSHRFNIIGEVLRPGSYPLGARMTVLDAVALAGGFQEFAKTTRIYVVRRQPRGASMRIPFDYKRAVRGDRRDLDLELEPGDTIIVP
ncbi:MAG TPA: polysaccharide biosynthesis/export family protein [Candidatus Acidoferrales bacterium]|nr:polysaccharide biosynthesis/export family protein [Candidatus Acidoferrales bacterium]